MDENIGIIGRSIGTMFANQRELAASESLLDEQFAVLSRLTIMALNEHSRKYNLLLGFLEMAMGKDLEEQFQQPEVTYEDVNFLFQRWAEFRQRSDFREHMRVWFTGGDLSTLPPPPDPAPAPEVKENNEGASDVSDQRNEGQEDGQPGDHGGENDEVPEVR